MQHPIHFDWSAKELSKLPVSKRLTHCPAFLQTIISNAKSALMPLRIWVFGSRARSDKRELSDYDLAFEIPETSIERWPLFVSENSESAKTLLDIDWVLFNSASKAIKDSILSEGILVYEHKT